MADESSLHSQHRQRLRALYRRAGFAALSDVQQLELLLFHAIPRQDTNPLAHRLLRQFGSLQGVLQAAPEALLAVPGVGENTAMLLNLCADLARSMEQHPPKEGALLASAHAVMEYARTQLAHAAEEEVLLLCLDARNRLLQQYPLGRGSSNAVQIRLRQVTEAALYSRAACALLVHGHPRGSAAPSPEDMQVTKRVHLALHSIGVDLLDHVIVGEGECYSFANRGQMEAIRMETAVRMDLHLAQPHAPYAAEPDV